MNHIDEYERIFGKIPFPPEHEVKPWICFMRYRKFSEFTMNCYLLCKAEDEAKVLFQQKNELRDSVKNLIEEKQALVRDVERLRSQ